MFHFIKKFFKEPEKEQNQVKLSELQDWFNKNSKPIHEMLNKELKEIKEAIALEIKKTNDNLEKLKNAKLMNPNISIREKQFMEGNRDSYIRSVNVLLNAISLEEDHDSILKFSDFFNEKLTQFAKTTAKAYQILQEFFGNETKEIAINIRKLDSMIKQVKQAVISKDMDKIAAIKEEIKNIDKKKFHKIELNKELKQKTKQQENIVNHKNELEKKIQEIKKSEEHDQHRALSELKRKYLDKIEDSNQLITHSFANIDAALKKYERIAFRDFDLISDYRKDPVRTLIKDTQFKIMEILDQTRKNIISGLIELKDTKKERTLKEIEKLTQDYFQDFLAGIGDIKKKMDDVDEQLRLNKSSENLKKLNEDLNRLNYDLEKVSTNVSYLNQEIRNIDFEKIKEKLQKEIKETLKMEVVIS